MNEMDARRAARACEDFFDLFGFSGCIREFAWYICIARSGADDTEVVRMLHTFFFSLLWAEIPGNEW